MKVRQLRVVREHDIFLKTLGHFATPMLIDLCNDGRGHEAWEQGGVWRARDDAYDATHKPADVPYTLVRVGYVEVDEVGLWD